MRHHDSERQLRAAIGRLEKSRTCLTRARAHRNLRDVLNRVEKSLLAKYPAIDLSGNVAKLRMARGCTCPICGVPASSTSVLASHLADRHNWIVFHQGKTIITCICGKVMAANFIGPASTRQVKTCLTYHLRKVPNLTEHFASGALRQIDG